MRSSSRPCPIWTPTALTRNLITAASSSVGLAAIQIANQIGTIALAVTRSAAKEHSLLAAGAAGVIVTDHDDV